MLLAGDVGATKTNLGIYSVDGGPRKPFIESTLPSLRFSSLEELVSEFLSGASIEIERASFGVAGPVVGGRARITNLPWVIEEARLRKTIGIDSVTIMNDLEAIAYGVTLVDREDLHTLNKGTPVHRGAMAVIAPGTGLGEAFLIWEGKRYRACPSEGGHADFGPNSDLVIDLLRYLREKFGHVSLERVCSGQGLPNLYAYLKESGYAQEQDWLAEQLSAADDPTPVIVNTALSAERRCELCSTTLEIFISALGAEAGNLALKVMATGGVYLGGGIPPRILSLLDEGTFMERFRNKGRFSELVSKIPVHVICNPKIALMGAALYGLEIARA
ncbi:MAG: glucokinase [Deltaproteobacteria bacterium]|nr:MAG: glucokinase [Deltaproteobacteria bacterium]